MNLVFTTLYPKDVHARWSLKNTLRLADEMKGDHKDWEVHFAIGSAHGEALEEFKKAVLGTKAYSWIHATTIHCPFKMKPEFTEERAHEISFSKQYMHRRLRTDWLPRHNEGIMLFIDSDMYIPWKHLKKWLVCLQGREQVVNYPYCVRGGTHAPPEQFGAYALHIRFLSAAAIDAIYTTHRLDDGRIARTGAPDCNLRRQLCRDGAMEMRAKDIYSEHYCFADPVKPEGVYVYNNGYCGIKPV